MVPSIRNRRSIGNGSITPKGTLGTSGGPTLRLYENGSMGDIYINQRLRQSLMDIFGKTPLMEVWLENTEYRKVGFILPKYYLGWNGSCCLKGWNLGFAFTGRFGGLVVSDTQAMIDKMVYLKVSAVVRQAGGVWVGDSKVDAEEYYSK